MLSHTLRQIIVRLSLAAVLAWFGAHQVMPPAPFARFVPPEVGIILDTSSTSLIRLHGALLLISSAGVLSGYRQRLAALLSAGLLLEIIVALAWIRGDNNLIIRDVGLLGLALSLAVDPTESRMPLLLPVFRNQYALETAKITPNDQTLRGAARKRLRMVASGAVPPNQTLDHLRTSTRHVTDEDNDRRGRAA